MPKYIETGVADPNVTAIALEKLKDVIKGLPDGDALELLKQLPENVVRQICEDGAKEELSQYIPWAIGGAAVLAIYFLMRK